ncbi:MAG: tetratricopeptide repeat protein, partial [Betaproteobacteria bacterium]|nr:tetratricopeptide repeat protein [Betaproteobacteria bacterium]
LLPAVGTDWRWLQERTDSPWYPGVVRLFRQTSAGRWEETVGEVARALKSVIDDQAKLPGLPVVRPQPRVLELVKQADALSGKGCHAEAAEVCRQAIALQPDCFDAHIHLGNSLKKQGRLRDAEASCRRAIELRPDQALAHYNLGNALFLQRELDGAESGYRRAIELQPDYLAAHVNLGSLLKDSARFAEAEAAYRSALELKPDFAEGRWNLSLLLLLQGKYAEGWPYYEARYDPAHRDRPATKPRLPFPQWQGEPLAGKSLVVWGEQGLGDEIQFARYLPLLKARGLTRLTLVGQPALKTLQQSTPGADAVISLGEALPAHDYWTFLLSLPLRFGTTLQTIPATLPYLRADPERMARWRVRLPRDGFKVGLVWRGSAGHKNDANRSLPGLAALAPLWAVPGDTAAIVAQLDLVVCVDTSVAHLAGALGKPCWVLLPAVGTDWRWLQERADSPWYPGVVRLFRQTSAGRWEETVGEVARALMDCAGNLPYSPHSGDSQPVAGGAKPPDKEIEPLVSLFAQQRFAEAEIRARAATGRYPRNAFVWKALGACLSAQGKKADAIEPMQKAAALDPDDVENHLNLALALKHQGRLAEAESSYRRVVGLQPEHVDARVNLGNVLRDLGRAIDAEQSYRRAIALKPDCGPAHFGLGVALNGLGRLAEAESSYRRAIEIKPGLVRAHGNLGNTLKDLGRLAEAESSYRRAIELDPQYVHATFNLGVALNEQNRNAEAESLFRRTIELQPSHVEAAINLGNILKERQDWGGAERYYRQAIALRPESAEARHNLGILLLSLGRYRAGWPYYEARYRPELKEAAVGTPNLAFPQWQGEALAGKSLVIWPEQGLGDEIQFARYLPPLKAQGLARLTLICQPGLKPLLQSMAGADAVLTAGEHLPPHDYWAFPLSLPLHFGTTLETVPAALPYLTADPRRIERWRPRLPEAG